MVTHKLHCATYTTASINVTAQTDGQFTVIKITVLADMTSIPVSLNGMSVCLVTASRVKCRMIFCITTTTTNSGHVAGVEVYKPSLSMTTKFGCNKI